MHGLAWGVIPLDSLFKTLCKNIDTRLESSNKPNFSSRNLLNSFQWFVLCIYLPMFLLGVEIASLIEGKNTIIHFHHVL